MLLKSITRFVLRKADICRFSRVAFFSLIFRTKFFGCFDFEIFRDLFFGFIFFSSERPNMVKPHLFLLQTEILFVQISSYKKGFEEIINILNVLRRQFHSNKYAPSTLKSTKYNTNSAHKFSIKHILKHLNNVFNFYKEMLSYFKI